MLKKKIFNKANLLVGISIAILNISFWAYINRPEMEPPWPDNVQGFSYAPMRADDNPFEGELPTDLEIESDLKKLSSMAHAVRTYAMDPLHKNVPKLAKKYGLNVTLGAWIDSRRDNNELEIDELVQAAEANKNVVRLVVGNEAILRGNVTIEEMISYLDRVRSQTKKPVSTAEPWHVWLKHPELADHVDYLGVHMLPYWEGVHVDVAIDYIANRMDELKSRFPEKPIVIAEVGWPSEGRTREASVASLSNEATFLRRFLKRAKDEGYIYYIMEAFDQPWKKNTEGAVGAYWGVYDVYREPKFAFKEPIVSIPNWHILAATSVIIGIIVLSIVLIDSRTLKKRGKSFLAIIVYAATTVVVWNVYNYTLQYLTLGSILVGILMFTGMIGVVVIILSEAHEWAELLWMNEQKRLLKRIDMPDDQFPMVSIHVPAYNEPVEMMKGTLDALARLNYPNFEVIVMDNNTKDSAIWQPVRDYCKELGDRFRFYHEDTLGGFKAGALNYALRKTDPRVEVIGVIDSDYVVSPNWLRDLVPQFTDKKVAIMQSPQDYSDDGENAFKAMCYSEYRGFFFIGMITRNERNAIIQHGTMTLIRKTALSEVGGWAEWCITEDAELGLKIFEHGYEAHYVPKCYGKGVMPDTFTDYKKQRFRWAYGSIQILKKHASALLKSGNSLSLGQKYHFIAGWMPWIADAANMIFNCTAILWTIAMLLAPRKIDAPMVEFALLPLILFSFKLGKMIYIYRFRAYASGLSIFGAALAGLALSHTIACAVIQGVATSNKPFFRTPKKANVHAMLRAILESREEILFAASLLLCAHVLSNVQGMMTLDMHLWIIVLVIQSIPYLATILIAVISTMPKLPAKYVGITPSMHF
jgi:exo-beta-1,3-glucanase (GH17 family)/cellulose synthase/poly-beta-1,6-N-acetylglucosamine synthase-like glycosyltransferase